MNKVSITFLTNQTNYIFSDHQRKRRFAGEPKNRNYEFKKEKLRFQIEALKIGRHQKQKT